MSLKHEDKPRRGRIDVPRLLLLIFGAALSIYALSDDPFLCGGPGFGKFQLALLIAGFLMAASCLLPRVWRARILMAAISLSIAFAAAEVFLNTFAQHRFRTTFERDDQVIFRLRPGSVGEFRHAPENGAGRVIHRVNRHGFRGPELLDGGSQARVVVYGDSFIQAIFTEQEKTFCASLAREIEKEGGGQVEVINAGVASYGPDQILLKMKRDLEWLKPDLVIVSIFAGNDYGDLERNRMFRLGEGDTLVPNPWKLSEELDLQFLLSRRESAVKRAIGAALRPAPGDPMEDMKDPDGTIRTQALLESWLDRAAEEHRSFVIEDSDIVTNVNVDFYNADCSILPDSASAIHRRRMMGAVIRRIGEVASRANVPLLVMVIPHPVDVCTNHDIGHVDEERYPHYKRRALTDFVASAAARNGIRCIDLYETFQQHGPEGCYLRGLDDHWNDAGQQVAASFVAKWIVRNQLLKHAPK